MLRFTIQATDTQSAARAAVVQTAHGTIETPVFMPVGTQSSVKSLSPAELEECGCSIHLANTYHLHLRPGHEVVRAAGGLHAFEHWNRSLLTDSGGFQVFSLRDISTISDEGVWFQSHIDGSRHFFSPQTVMEIQRCLGADIIMAFDECPPAKAPAPVIAAAVRRTLEWACRCKEYHSQTPPCFDYTQSLFGIVQGGTDLSLRSLCSEKLTALDFPGYAIGGCAVGESIGQMYSVVTHTAALLPVDKPRYLMGVGKPSNILECIASGVDMFDCVLPTRNGRNGSVFTWKGRINIKNACHSQAFNTPLDELCSCYTCRTFSRAYLRHLFMAKEILAIRSFTLHNIHFFQELMRHARRHIIDGTFVQWKKTTLESMKTHADDEAQIR